MGLLSSKSSAGDSADDSYTVHGIQYLPSKVKKSRRRQTKQNLNRVKIYGSESKDMCLMNGALHSWRSCNYPFENLVFSGGGSKGYAYIGALQALDDCGILPRIKRVAGSSVGAICGSLVAVGCTPQELADVFAGDEYYVKWMFLDQKCVGCCGVPKIWKNYGVNNASRFYKILGEYYVKKVGSADITFQQLYDTYGMELCIPVTNLTRMCSEYCHWKTTPNMPIRVAVRMSMSLPVLYEPVKYMLDGETECVYSDGGTLDQYPIHCFDGPELELNHNSMKKEEATDSYNENTIGLYVISECTIDYKIWRGLFDRDIPYKPTYFPQTKLSKERFDEEYRRRKRREPSYTRQQMSDDFKDEYNSSEWLHYDTVSKEHVDITSFGKFVLTAIETLMVSQRKVHVKPHDADRTVGINCGYVGTNDYEMQPGDREYLIKQGYAHTKNFLRDYVAKHADPKRATTPSSGIKQVETEIMDAPKVTCDSTTAENGDGSEVACSPSSQVAVIDDSGIAQEIVAEVNSCSETEGDLQHPTEVTPLSPEVTGDDKTGGTGSKQDTADCNTVASETEASSEATSDTDNTADSADITHISSEVKVDVERASLLVNDNSLLENQDITSDSPKVNKSTADSTEVKGDTEETPEGNHSTDDFPMVLASPVDSSVNESAVNSPEVKFPDVKSPELKQEDSTSEPSPGSSSDLPATQKLRQRSQSGTSSGSGHSRTSSGTETQV